MNLGLENPMPGFPLQLAGHSTILETLTRITSPSAAMSLRLVWVISASIQDGRVAQCESGVAATNLSFTDR
jgi:hypothetical protein